VAQYIYKVVPKGYARIDRIDPVSRPSVVTKLSSNYTPAEMASRKVIIVTGGNSGIGYETVKAFLQSDKAYRILLGSRTLEKGKLAIESLRDECPESSSTVEALPVDLESDESIGRAFEQVKSDPGHVDILVNNAGMLPLV